MADSTQPGEDEKAKKAKKAEYMRLYREKNKAKIAANMKRWREENKERESAKWKIYYEQNKETIAARRKTPEARQRQNETNAACGKRYRARHPDRVRQKNKRYREKYRETVRQAAKRYRERNPEEYRKAAAEHCRNYRKRFRDKHGKSPQAVRADADPAFKLEVRVRCRVTAALRRVNASKNARIMELVGCSVSELRRHIESQFVDGMTWANWTRDGWHIDHRIPLASFDLLDPEQQAVAFHYTNLQPLWAADNIRKGDKIPSARGGNKGGRLEE